MAIKFSDKNSSFIAPVNTIQVRVVDYPNGLRVFDNVQMARILSDNYNLLIMADHIPTLGEIHGTLEIVDEDGIKNIENINAFYMHRKNVLSVLIKD